MIPLIRCLFEKETEKDLDWSHSYIVGYSDPKSHSQDTYQNRFQARNRLISHTGLS